jgi:hypothetical protein
MVVMETNNSVRYEIYAQRVTMNGELKSWFYVSEGVDPDIAYNPVNNEYLIVWREVGPADIKGKRVNASGSFQGDTFDIFAGSGFQGDPSVVFNSHGNFQDYMVVWEEFIYVSTPLHQHSHIIGQRVAGTTNTGDGGGELIGKKISVVTNPYPAGPATYDPDIAYNLNMNEYLVVYTSDPGFTCDPDAPNINGTRLTADGHVLLTSDIDSSMNAQTAPQVAAYHLNHDTPYLVIFEDMWKGDEDIRGYLLDKEAHSISLINIAEGPGVTRWSPAIDSSVSSGGYTVVWSEGKFTGVMHIIARRVENTGETGSVFTVSDRGLSAGGYYEIDPAVALGSPLTLVVWEDGILNAWVPNVYGRFLGYRVLLPMMRK